MSPVETADDHSPVVFFQPATRFFLLLVLALFTFMVRRVSAQPETARLIISPVREEQVITLRGSTHRLAQARFMTGTAPADLPMDRMLLMLKRSPEQDAALNKLLEDQQDKASPSYHQWLTPEEFGRRFGPSDADIQTITGWITSHGFRVTSVTKGRTAIEFSGTASQVQETFHTTIRRFTVNGEDHWANASDPQIPAALAPAVAGIHTLHNFSKRPLHQMSPLTVRARALPGARPEFTGSTGAHALVPADVQTIYNIDPNGPTGHGTTIAIVGRSNIVMADVTAFLNWTSTLALAPQIVVNGPDPGDLGAGEEAEAVLDVTWAAAAAPGAQVVLVASASTNASDGVDLSELYIVDNNLADVMSESFGDCEANYNQTVADDISALAKQAAAQGITYTVSAGDAGSAGCDDPNTKTVASHPPSVNILASTPYNVAVGGTVFNDAAGTYWSAANDLSTHGSALSYIPEDVWNESCSAAQCGSSNANIWAGGGGPSTFITIPSWQSGVTGIPTDGMRHQPDVSLAAAGHTPYLICLRGSCIPDAQGFIQLFAASGTSASTPIFGGIMARVVQKTGVRQGNPNYVLYRLAAQENFSQCNGSLATPLPASSCVFNDITVGNNAVPGVPNYGTASAPYQSTAGYDMATGLGSVNVTNLLNAWNTVTFNPTTTTASFSPLTFVHGSPVTVDITVTSNAGTPTGPVWLKATNLSVGNGLVDLFTLNAGTVHKTTHLLPGGQYQASVHYAGDGTFAPSDSALLAFDVSAEPSTTTVTVFTLDGSGNPVPFTSGPRGTPVYVKAHVAGQSGFGRATQPVNIVLDGTYWSAVPDANGDYVITPTLATGAHSVHAAFTGDESFNASTSATANFTITPNPDFSLAVTGDPITLVAGQSGTATVAVSVIDGFNGSVTFNAASCSGLPDKASCSFNPSSVTGSGSTVITVTTTAATTARLRPSAPLPWWIAGSGTALAGIVLLFPMSRMRRIKAMLSLLAFALFLQVVACGGSSNRNGSHSGTTSVPGTPAGSYTITVTGTSGSRTHQTTVTLNVH